jgi:hypothetical protein
LRKYIKAVALKAHLRVTRRQAASPKMQMANFAWVNEDGTAYDVNPKMLLVVILQKLTLKASLQESVLSKTNWQKKDVKRKEVMQ